jgi:adenylate cyclase
MNTAVVANMPEILMAILSLGMAGIFFFADRKTPTTRASAYNIAGVGSLFVWAQLEPDAVVGDWVFWWGFGYTSLLTLTILAGIEWVRRVQRTSAALEGRRWFGGIIPRLSQTLVVAYWILSLIFQDTRPIRFNLIFTQPSEVSYLTFWVLAVPLIIALLLAGLSIFLTRYQRSDKAEVQRLSAAVWSAPLLLANEWLPPEYIEMWMAPATLVGLLILFAGNIRYLMVQAKRGQFMSRFMSPQVASLVRNRGLKGAFKTEEVELSVVSCDLRGFTAWAAARSSVETMTLLNSYYRCVGDIVKKHNGTIKDYAGDGVLILVGAPLKMEDHRQRALSLASEIVRKVSPIIGELGVGVGVATGQVSVGAIGGAERFEYAAVGSAVNMASRLCDKARDGQVLTTLENGEEADFSLDLKGFKKPVPVISLTPAQALPD